jgi:hypothetical protein
MIARSAQTAAVAVLAVTLLGLALPQAAQARDYGRDSHSYGYQYADHRGHDYDNGRRYAPQRHYGRGHHKNHYRYAPRYYPDVVVYPEVRRYYYAPYYAPYYAEPAYPREYGTVGIHLDYNLLF